MLKTQNESLQEKLSEALRKLSSNGEEKNNFEKLIDELEKEKKEIECKSLQQENRINQLIKSQEEVNLNNYCPS